MKNRKLSSPSGKPGLRSRQPSRRPTTRQASSGGVNSNQVIRKMERIFNNRKRPAKQASTDIPPIEPGHVRVVTIGGVEEVGKNMTVVETEKDMFVIDAGFHFVDGEANPGVDYIIPNINYVVERKHKLRALLITHGHLDHIGAIPFIIERLGYPTIYTMQLTELLIRKRQEEFPTQKRLDFYRLENNQTFEIAGMKITAYPVTHSIPDSQGFVFHTDVGNIIVGGDMKVDYKDGKPVDREVETFSKIGAMKNNILHIGDSTNAAQQGIAPTENEILANIEEIIRGIKGRVIIGSFASQFRRMIGLIKIGEKLGKKVVIDGRSMKTNVEVARLSGMFDVADGVIIPISDIDKYPSDKLLIIVTGSQGEEFAVLARAGRGEHRYVKLNGRDTVILSASVVPGNEVSVQVLKDGLTRHGVHLIHYMNEEVHISGHAKIDELVWTQQTIGAKFFMPGYGHHFMHRAHADGVIQGGKKPEEVIIPDNGTIVDFNEKGYIRYKQKAPHNITIVDGFSVGDIQDVVMNDRKILTKDGFIVAVVLVDVRERKIRKSPDIVSRGFVYLRTSQELIQNTRNVIRRSVMRSIEENKHIDFDNMRKQLSNDISRYISSQTAKRPIIAPIIIGL